MGILICSFDRKTGWRVKRREVEGDPRIRVVIEDGVKLLSIPSIQLQKNGRFCNPVKLAVEWTSVCGYPGAVARPQEYIKVSRPRIECLAPA
jgi:hypothetical protein